MKSIVLILTVFFSVFSFGQMEADAVSRAKKLHPGFESYKYVMKSDAYYERLIPFYYYYVEMSKNAGVDCCPSAQRSVRCMIGYWGGTKYKENRMSSRDEVLTNMPTISESKIRTVIPDDAALLQTYPAYDLLAMKEVGPFKIEAGDEVYWRRENEVWVKATANVTWIRATELVESKETIVLVFSTPDCGKTLTFVKRNMYSGAGIANALHAESVEIRRTSHSREEIKAFKGNSVGRQLGDQLAKKEWDNLVPLDIPNGSAEEISAFAHKLFSTGSPEEVKAFLYHTTPKYRYMDGNEYEFDYIQQEFIPKVMRQVFEGEKNYRNEYCETSVVANRTKKGLSYANHNLSSRSNFYFIKEGDKYVMESCVFGFSQEGIGSSGESDARQHSCRGELTTERSEMEDIFCGIDFPEGVKSIQTNPSRLKKVHYNTSYDACNYDVWATFMDKESRSNADRYAIVKATGDNYISGTDNVIKSSTKDFEINGVKGYEVNLTYHRANDIHQSVTRFILLGDVFYEFSVTAPLLRENEIATLNTFTSTLKGGSGIASNNTEVEESLPTSYNVGDNVLIRMSQTDWVPGEIVKNNGSDNYLVKIKSNGDHYNQPIKNIKPDPNASGAKKRKLPKFKLR